GFEWIDLNHRDECVIVYRRKGPAAEDELLVILNLTPVVRWDWPIELTNVYYTKEIFNSDDKKYWGSGDVFNPEIRWEEVTEPIKEDAALPVPEAGVRDDKTEKKKETVKDKKYRISVNLPPLSALILK
ncbi:MAG: alpha amylase C-terminal domain-containing protein, partial [Chitinophagaceae bacterium]